MMAELYRVSFQQDEDRKPEDWFNPQGLGGAMDRVRGRANKWPKGETRQRDRGEEWGNWRPDLNQALFQFKGAVEANRPGDIRVLQHRNRDLVLVRNVHVPDVDYPNIISNATPNVRKLIQPLWDEFPQLEYWGCFNCRRIANSSILVAALLGRRDRHPRSKHGLRRRREPVAERQPGQVRYHPHPVA